MLNAQSASTPSNQMPAVSTAPATTVSTTVSTTTTSPTNPVTPPDNGPFQEPDNRNSLLARMKRNWKVIAGVLLFSILLIGAGVGYYLSQQQQDVRQQAAGSCGTSCHSDGDCGGGMRCKDNSCKYC